jgi:Divergent InlB B-repeat domain
LVLIGACVLLTAAGTPSSAAIRQSLPRATADRPDEATGPQVHVFYVIPAGGTDRGLDTDGTIAASSSNFQAWLRSQTGGRNLRLDTYSGQPDVTFAQLAETDAQMAANGAFVRDAIERELIARGLTKPGKIYAVYYDGSSTYSCGGGAWPPALPGIVGALYLRATVGGVTCYHPEQAKQGIGYMDFAILHELLHTLGFVPTCAPHQTLAGHVSDSPEDLMYAGPEPWRPSVLDVGHDDYYDARVPGCPDLTSSSYFADAALPRYTVTVRIAARGGTGTVASVPRGLISCPPTCAGQADASSTLQLIARPRKGSRFVRWDGACVGANPTCRLTLTANAVATATFARAKPPRCKRGQKPTKRHPCTRR